MQACAASRAFTTAGLRVLPVRPARAPLTVCAASRALPPSGGSGNGARDVPTDVSTGELVTIFTTLGLTGASVGTYMDGIHSRAHVLVYDLLPLVHGGLQTSAVVPPLLAAYYIALGGLVFKADGWLLQAGDAATQSAYRRLNLGTMCLSFG